MSGQSGGRGFASDNHAGAHPEILDAVVAANDGHAVAYGEDSHTVALADRFREHFGAEAVGFPVFNGSGANVASIDAVTRSYGAVICTELAHMHVDECGAPERIAGAKLLTVSTDDGKLTADDVSAWEHRRGDDHFPQPGLVSITQSTEAGTVYTLEETRAIVDAAHQLGMLVHVDGSRLANAAATLGAGLGELTTDCGVDLVSFGGTKNGLLFGEAVIFLKPRLGEGFQFVRKQLGQLASKMRFISAQFDALLSDDLWLRNATHANEMATQLAEGVRGLDGLEIVYPVQANGVFAKLPRPAIDRLLEAWPYPDPFYLWDEAGDVVRWMCAWDTRPEDVEAFARAVADALSSD